MFEEVVSCQETARRLGVSEQTVYRLLKAGQLPAVRVGVRRLVVPVEAVNNYLASRKSVLVSKEEEQ